MSKAETGPKRSVSPSNKLLVKRVLNYYELLENLRKNEGYRDLKRNGSRSPSPRAGGPLKGEPYVDSEFRDAKISELKPILQKELVQARREKVFEPTPEQASKAYSGYPSFTYRRQVKSTKRTDSKPSSASKSPLKRASEILGSPVRDFNPKDTVFECGLLPLDTRNRLFPQIGDVLRKRHEAHQNHSKEIRRLQYQAALSSNPRSPKKPPTPSKPQQPQPSPPEPPVSRTTTKSTTTTNNNNNEQDIRQLIQALEARVNERMQVGDGARGGVQNEGLAGEGDEQGEGFESVADVAPRAASVVVSKDVLRVERPAERVPVQPAPHVLARLEQVYLRSQKLEANVGEDESDRSFSSGPDIQDDADPVAKDFENRYFDEGPLNSHSEGSDLGMDQEAQASSEDEDDVGRIPQEMQRYSRTLPDESFAVFRPTSSGSHPQGIYGEISCPDGFLIDLFESKLLIKNNDRIWLRIYDPPGAFHGKVKRYKPEIDHSCDFVVIENGSKARIPLIVDNSSLVAINNNQAPKNSSVETQLPTKRPKEFEWGQQCTAISPSTNQTYPQAEFYLDSDWIPKSSTSSLKLSSNPIDNGVLLDSTNTVSRCLVRWLSASTMSLKTTKHGLRRMSVLKSSELLLDGVSVIAYTLDDIESRHNPSTPVHEIVVCVDEAYKIIPDLLIGSERASLKIHGYPTSDRSELVKGTVVLQPGIQEESPRIFLLSKEISKPSYFEIVGLDAKQTLKKLFKISQVLKKMVGYQDPDISSPELSARMQPKSPKSVRFTR